MHVQDVDMYNDIWIPFFSRCCHLPRALFGDGLRPLFCHFVLLDATFPGDGF